MSVTSELNAPTHAADLQTPRRVLMLAYACSPYRGSEPGVGWQRAAEMAKYFEIWVITEEHEFRQDIERYVRENGPIENLVFRYVPRMFSSEKTWGRLSELKPLYYLAYKRWHKKAYRLARDLSREVQFDLVHQSTMCGFREPGQLWKLDVPFIWGPVGGTENFPWRFLPQAGLSVAVKEGARSVLNHLQMRCTPRVRKASRRASVLLTAIPAGKRKFKLIHGIEAVCMLDVGVNHVSDTPRTYRERQRPLRLLWSGSFEPRKALHLLLRAVAQLPEGFEYDLRILGRGPRERPWRKLAGRLGVEDRCTWMGWLTHDDAMKQIDWADVFVFTSLRDTCGTVVLEALSRGLPVICLDHQGVGSVVTEDCGIKIPVTGPRRVVEGLRDAIIDAGRSNQRLEALSRGAIDRAHDYRWRVHGERLAGLYRDVVTGHTDTGGPPNTQGESIQLPEMPR